MVRWVERDGLLPTADVEFDGVRRTCHMACVPLADIGDYVLIHAGVAITQIDPVEAARTLAELSRHGDDDGWAREGVHQPKATP